LSFPDASETLPERAGFVLKPCRSRSAYALGKPRISLFFKDDALFKHNALDFPESGSRQTCGNFIVTPEFRISRRHWQPFPAVSFFQALQSTGFGLFGNYRKWGVLS
jgi:hypothetical protein